MVLFLVGIVVLATDCDFDKRKQLCDLQPLAFTSPTIWEKEVEASTFEDTYLSVPLYPPSFVISEALDALLQSVSREFITSWFSNVSKDPSFPLLVEKQIRHALARLRDRLQTIDIVEVFVGKIVPLLTTHLNEFSVAEKAVRGKHLENSLTESEELDLAIAAKYRDGKLHPAASLAFSDMKLAQYEHLRVIATRLLSSLIPEKEQKSRGLGILLREVVALAILHPAMTMLSDPDFWNQLTEALVCLREFSVLSQPMLITYREDPPYRTVRMFENFVLH